MIYAIAQLDKAFSWAFAQAGLPFNPDMARKACGTGLLAGILMVAWAVRMPDQFTATARILPKESKAGVNMSPAASAASAMGLGFGGEDPGLGYLDILRSRRVADQILGEQFTFHEKRWMFGPRVAKAMDLKTWLGVKSLDRASGKLRKLLDVQRDMKSGMITLSVTTQSPDLSARLVREYVSQLEEYLTYHNQTQAGAKAVFVAGRLRIAEAKSKEAEKDFQGFLTVNRNYQTSPDPVVRLMGSRLEADLSMRRLMVSNLNWSLEQALMDEKNDTPILNILDAGQDPDAKSGPPRLLMVISASLGGIALSFGWNRRHWLIKQAFSSFGAKS